MRDKGIALGVKVVFNWVNFEWQVTVKLTSKFVFYISIKKISCKDMEIKKKSWRVGRIKKISDDLKILHPPPPPPSKIKWSTSNYE